MKLTSLCLFLGLFAASATNSFSQVGKVTLKMKSVALSSVFDEIEAQTSYSLFYKKDALDDQRIVSVNAKDEEVSKVLNSLLSDDNVSYKVLENSIIIVPESLRDDSKIVQETKIVSGNVVDENGGPIPGVSILVKGTVLGTITDVNGRFSVEAPVGSTLVFSFIGFVSQEVVATPSMNIVLKEDFQKLDEVVVIAYGTAKKKDLTGAMTAVDTKMIAIQNTSSATKALEGQVPGLQLSTVDGQPGLDAAIRVRGVGSGLLNASGALIVIDGVPAQMDNPLSNINQQDIQSISVLKDAASTAMYGSRGANGVVLVTTKSGSKGKTKVSFETRTGFSQVGPFMVDKIDQPADVYEYQWQSIYNSVRYGMGDSGLPENFQTNLQTPNMSHDEAAQFASAHLFDYANSTTDFQRNTLSNMMLYDVPGAIYTPSGSGTSASSTMSGAYLVNPDGKINPNAKLLFGTGGYEKELLQNRMRQEYNVSARGGSEKVDFFVSLGYLDQPSYLINSNFERYSGRANVNAQLYDWFKVGANVGYSHTNTASMATTWGTGRNAGSNSGNILRTINGQMALIPLYARDQAGDIIMNEDGTRKVHVNDGDTYSPVGPTRGMLYGMDIMNMVNKDVNDNGVDTWNARTYAEFSFLKHFKLRTNLSLDKTNRFFKRYKNGEDGPGTERGLKGGMSTESYDYSVLNTQELLTYDRDITEDHHVDVLVGHEFNDYGYDRVVFGSGYELIPGFISASNFVGRYKNSRGMANPNYVSDIVRMESYLGRANYVYKNKYYASGSFRRDGSSKFKYSEDRWGTFWSVGGGWRISSEDFMEGTKGWLDNMKLRASYGVIGNQNGIGNHTGYRTWKYGAKYVSTTNGTGTPDSYTMSVGGMVNDHLTWENTKTFDAGVDFSLFNRIYGTLDVYNRLTDNSFWNAPVSYLATGQNSLQQNTASIRNRGFEVELGAEIIKNDNFSWNLSLNGTHYTAVITDVPEGSVTLDEDGGWNANGEGWSASGTGNFNFVEYHRGIDKNLYEMYLYKYAGVDESTGLPLYLHKVNQDDVDANTYAGSKVGDDVKITDYSDASRYECGDAIPKWIGGLSTTLRYKDFDLTAVLSYQLGGKFLSVEYANGMYISERLNYQAKSDELIGNTWTPENTSAKFPMQWYAGGTQYVSGSTTGSWKYTDMALFSASYLKMKNITLGYTLPNYLLQKYQISKLRLFASVDNLFLLSAASGVDPSMSLTGGMDVAAYTFPDMRTFTFGLNLDF